VQPLEKVAPQIKQLLERREAVRLARAAGEERLAALRKQQDKTSEAGFSAPKWVSRRQPQDLPPDVLTEVLRTSPDKLPQYLGTEVGADFRSSSAPGYIIVQVTAAKPGEALPPAQREAQHRAITQQIAAAAELAYADGLKARHNVQVLRPELQRKAADSDKKGAEKGVTDKRAAAEPSNAAAADSNSK
jgi:peptidyl-prolyl cis-trans isomerase D